MIEISRVLCYTTKVNEMSQEDNDMKHKLVAVVGNTPQVMTETFWALHIQRRHVPIDEVYVITTTVGQRNLSENAS